MLRLSGVRREAARVGDLVVDVAAAGPLGDCDEVIHDAANTNDFLALPTFPNYVITSGQNSTELAFALLILYPWVQLWAFLKLFHRTIISKKFNLMLPRFTDSPA